MGDKEIESFNEDNFDESLMFLPEKLKAQLMPFQKQGIQFGIHKNGRCLIADEMGLGKTLQALSLAFYYRNEWPLLIVVPSSLRYPWTEEIEKWFPSIKPQDINLIETGSDISEISSSLITIVTYGLLRHPASKFVQEALFNQSFKVVILDESHYIKNRNASTTKYIVPLLHQADRKILLTGTPALNCPQELFPQLDALNPGMFSSWSNFSKRYCDAGWRYFGRQRRWMTDGASNLEELESRMKKTVMIRRLKRNVLTQLPPKQRQKILFKLKDSDVKKELESVIEDLKTEMGKNKKSFDQLVSFEPAQSADDSSTGSNKIFGLMSRLHMQTCTAKIGPVKEYIKMLCENKDLKFIVFAFHRQMLDGITEQLIDSSVKFIRIDGSTVGHDRPRLISQFQNDTTTRVALLSIKAAGVGLTLTAASLVIFAELDWTPGTLDQCEDRAHRIGQKDVVNIHYLVASGTLDEWVWSSLAKKTTIVSTTLNGKKQILRMGGGTVEQVECLDNADVYVPSKDTNISLISFLQKQPSSQRNLLDYFKDSQSPKAPKKLAIVPSNSSLNFTDTLDKSPALPSSEESFNEILISSGSEDEISTPVSKRTTKQDSRSASNSKGKRGRGSNGNSKNAKKQKLFKDDNKWSCLACTFLNHSAIAACEICDTPRKKRVVNDINETGSNDDFVFEMNDNFFNSSASKRVKIVSPGKTRNLSPSRQRSLSPSRPRHVSPNRTRDLSPSRVKNISPTRARNISPSRARNDLLLAQDAGVDSKQRCGKVGWKGKHLNKIIDEPLFEFDEIQSPSHLKNISTPVSLNSSLKDISFCLDDEDENDNVEDLFSQCASYLSANTSLNEPESELNSSSANTPNSSKSVPRSSRKSDQLQLNNFNLKSDLESFEQSRKSAFSEVCVNDSINNDEIYAQSDSDTVCDSDGENLIESPDCVPLSPQKSQSSPDEDQAEVQFSRAEVELSHAEVELDHAEVELSHPEVVADPSSVDPALTIDLDRLTVYDSFQFCCSRVTSRIYLYDESGNPLERNFLPLDVELQNFSELPDILLHPHNLQLIRRFVREWNSLTQTKRRLISSSCQLFVSPMAAYESLKMGKLSSKQRYTSKTDVAAVSIKQAMETGGSLRVIQKTLGSGKQMSISGCFKKGNNLSSPPVKSNEDKFDLSDSELAKLTENLKGFVQIIDSNGNPLCLQCQTPFDTSLLTRSTIDGNPWQTRLCSRLCFQQFWTRSHREFSVKQVYEADHGVCQLCNFDAQDIFVKIKALTSLEKRAKLIQDSPYSTFSVDVKEKMVRTPQQGLFWNVDHIVAVSDGGGQCDIGNLRTLCTVCHKQVTREQNKDRVKQKMRLSMANCKDIKAFFKPV